MLKNYVPRELCKELKELGFDEPCIAWWWHSKDIEISVPTQTEGFWQNFNEYVTKMRVSAPFWQQAFRWFRDKHKLIAVPHYVGGDYKLYDILVHDDLSGDEIEDAPRVCDTYEIAEEECLKRLIEILGERQKIIGDL